MNIKKAQEIIENVKEVMSKWNEYATDAGIAGPQVRAIGATHLLNI